MKKYKIIVSEGTIQKLHTCLFYLKAKIKSQQAAKAVYNDYVQTRKSLQETAGSIQLCEDPDLARLGYRRINFKKHNYFLLFRIEDDKVYIDYIFHGLEDFRNKMR